MIQFSTFLFHLHTVVLAGVFAQGYRPIHGDTFGAIRVLFNFIQVCCGQSSYPAEAQEYRYYISS